MLPIILIVEVTSCRTINEQDNSDHNMVLGKKTHRNLRQQWHPHNLKEFLC